MTIDSITGLQIPDTGLYEYGTLVVTRYLKTRVTTDIVVATEIPNPRPTRLIVVKGAQTSGRTNIALAKRRSIIHCFDATEVLACRMAEIVCGYLIDGMFQHGSGFRGVTVIGEPMYFPDPDDPAKTPRAQLTVDLLQRARSRSS